MNSQKRSSTYSTDPKENLKEPPSKRNRLTPHPTSLTEKGVDVPRSLLACDSCGKSVCGDRHHENEDTLFICDTSQIPFWGVFDGHGFNGRRASETARDAISSCFIKEFAKHDLTFGQIKERVSKAFKYCPGHNPLLALLSRFVFFFFLVLHKQSSRFLHLLKHLSPRRKNLAQQQFSHSCALETCFCLLGWAIQQAALCAQGQ